VPGGEDRRSGDGRASFSTLLAREIGLDIAGVADTAVPFPKRAKRYLRYLVLRALMAVTGLLPLALAGALGEQVGALGYFFAGKERRKALASLARAWPEWTEAQRVELARRAFRHLGRAAGEMVCVRQLDARRAELVEWPKEDRARMDAALARGKGVVFVTGHVGNWEVLARHVALEGYPAAVIGKEASDPRTTAMVERFRTSGKLRVIWRGAAGAAKDMLRTLRGNGILGLLIDQDTKVQSVWVPFFGHLAKTPRAAADLALRTGAVPMLGFAVRVAPGRYRISMQDVALPESEGEAAVTELTAALTRGIEAAIRANPEQWVWMHERWKSPPPAP
jgi:KDO2-lipid IV(A) lauroyltransferase